MIKIELHNTPYHYDNINAHQSYDVKMTVEVEQDATANEVIMAMMEVLKAATYRVDARTLINAAYDYAYEHGQEDLLDSKEENEPEIEN